MKAEAYVQFTGEFMLPLRLAEALGELVPLKSRYESGIGYVYSIADNATQPLDCKMFSKEQVAAMIAADKLK